MCTPHMCSKFLTRRFVALKKKHPLNFLYRSNGAIKTKRCLNAVQSSSTEEAVHDVEDSETVEQSPTEEKTQSKKSISAHSGSLTFHGLYVFGTILLICHLILLFWMFLYFFGGKWQRRWMNPFVWLWTIVMSLANKPAQADAFLWIRRANWVRAETQIKNLNSLLLNSHKASAF